MVPPFLLSIDNIIVGVMTVSVENNQMCIIKHYLKRKKQANKKDVLIYWDISVNALCIKAESNTAKNLFRYVELKTSCCIKLDLQKVDWLQVVNPWHQTPLGQSVTKHEIPL